MIAFGAVLPFVFEYCSRTHEDSQAALGDIFGQDKIAKAQRFATAERHAAEPIVSLITTSKRRSWAEEGEGQRTQTKGDFPLPTISGLAGWRCKAGGGHEPILDSTRRTFSTLLPSIAQYRLARSQTAAQFFVSPDLARQPHSRRNESRPPAHPGRPASANS